VRGGRRGRTPGLGWGWVPNALTVVRVVLVVPLVALLAGHPEGSLAAALVFALAAATDCLDGHLARSRGAVTTFGTLADSLADKLLVGSALVVLAAEGRVAAWIVAVILGREAAVSALRAVARRRGVILAANRLGKAKMTVQIVALLALISAPDPHAPWLLVLLGVTVALTLVSGASYFLGAEWRTSDRARPGATAAIHAGGGAGSARG
jgi:CDP-diacylglycerol--glycerol-3-phosphate 3-phosphatidyltransferase